MAPFHSIPGRVRETLKVLVNECAVPLIHLGTDRYSGKLGPISAELEDALPGKVDMHVALLFSPSPPLFLPEPSLCLP